MTLTSLTITEAAKLITSGDISPVDLTIAHLERIQRIDPKINSYLTITSDSAIAAAGKAVDELRQDKSVDPMNGIPIGLKDLIETKGVLTTAGSKFFADYVPESDAFIVQRLAEVGAVILGKLNLHEIALGVTNVNPHYGTCRNPWDLERVSGGSSGGSAAALAAGLCMGALGTDTGGSIRIPASLCGIVGLKPTYGRVSCRGVFTLSWNLDHVGPMARRVKDTAILLAILGGYDPLDPYSKDVPVDNYLEKLAEGVRGWRIALATDEFFSKADPQVIQAVRQAGAVFTVLGARVEEVDFPKAYEAARANGLMTVSDAAAFHQKRLESSPEGFGDDVRERLKAGAAFTSTEYILARHTQSLLRHQYNRFFDDFDILLTPTTPVAAPPIDGPDAVEQATRLTRFTAPFNITGFPALSIPCGFTEGGLPIGLQIVSRPWSEAAVLQAGYAYEQATEWHKQKPAIELR
jgi:aspartyl-tRNA(Asn)/glutamyl-tRNA(Gln) amidotransferase subunit A